MGTWGRGFAHIACPLSSLNTFELCFSMFWVFENFVQCIWTYLPLFFSFPLPPFHVPNRSLRLFFFFFFPLLPDGVQFVLPGESWEQCLLWHLLILPWVTLFKKTQSPSSSSYQSQQFLSGRFCLAGAWAGLVHSVTIAVSSSVQLSCCTWKTPFLDAIHHFCLSQSFCPLSRKVPKLWGRVEIKNPTYD